MDLDHGKPYLACSCCVLFFLSLAEREAENGTAGQDRDRDHPFIVHLFSRPGYYICLLSIIFVPFLVG
jgi:hypothetical protein